MAHWVDRCVAGWVDATLAAVLVTGLAALAMIQCRQPARRRVWGRLGLSASLAVIPLAWLDPLPELNVRHPSTSFWAAGRPTLTVDAAAALAEADPAVAAARPLPWARLAGRALLVAYGAGLALSLGRIGLGLVGTGLLARRSTPASARAEALRDALAAEAAGPRPRLGVSALVGRPVLVGIRRPTILIPPDLDRPGAEDQLRLGLIHELAHVEMGDHRFGPVAALAQAVWFFLPQAWWARNQLRLDAEFLADHRAVAQFGTSYGYAASLVGLAAPASGATARPATARPPGSTDAAPAPRGPGGLASALFQRVQMLLKCPFEVEDRAPRAWSLGVAAVVAAATLAASSLTTRDEGPDDGSGAIEALERGFHLAKLNIAPQLLDDRPFDLHFHLPAQFRLDCWVEAAAVELGEVEILGYRLGPVPGVAESEGVDWRRVVIERAPGGLESVRVDDREVVPSHRPKRAASWLTIRPIPARVTRLKDLYLFW